MRNNPYEHMHDADRIPVKTNFHAHAGVCIPNDCGELPMDDVVEAYRRAQYGALAISNHNRYVDHRIYEGISVLDAVEYSAHPHMLFVGTRNYYDVPHQQAIDLALAEGAFVVLNHPNWMNHKYWPWKMMEELTGYTGIEIVNPVIFRLKGSGIALDAWDHLLTKGHNVFGFGNDDFHLWRDLERSYNVIFSRSSGFDDISAAIKEGCFYVSDGVALKNVKLSKTTLEVEAGFFTESYINTFEYTLVGTGGKVLGRVIDMKATFEFPDSELYIRVEVRAENGAKLFTQPMMLSN